MASTEEIIRTVVMEQLGANREQLTPEAKFVEDLGADSLDIVEMVMEFEEEFNIEISDEDADKILTFGEAVKYIEGKLTKS